MAGETTFEASRPAPGVGLVAVRGEIDLRCAGVFRDVLGGLLADDACRRVVLDVAAMPYLDSAALGVIVEAVRRLRDRDPAAALSLAAPVPFVRRTFHLTSLVRLVTLCDTVEEALNAAGIISADADKYTSEERTGAGQ